MGNNSIGVGFEVLHRYFEAAISRFFFCDWDFDPLPLIKLGESFEFLFIDTDLLIPPSAKMIGVDHKQTKHPGDIRRHRKGNPQGPGIGAAVVNRRGPAIIGITIHLCEAVTRFSIQDFFLRPSAVHEEADTA
ncbi:MAG: hypothetical protein UZ16_OP3001000996 [Candidatus Hinthialibacteria bacterium OLB16]|nr:MAG: hypothetical protein UZ16_OP3001000996 [Candidatus Hinthialibacteria bacterium OLB16]